MLQEMDLLDWLEQEGWIDTDTALRLRRDWGGQWNYIRSDLRDRMRRIQDDPGPEDELAQRYHVSIKTVRRLRAARG
jgi:hypothetical protein